MRIFIVADVVGVFRTGGILMDRGKVGRGVR
jgi:hypothetical protein